MTRLKLIGIAVILIAAGLAGCSGDKQDPLVGLPSGGGGGNSDPTYAQDVKPIFDQNCVLCHDANKSGGQRNGAPVSVNFDTYEQLLENLERASARIQAGTMPPAGPLDSELVNVFLEWIAAGTPRGDS